MKKLLFLLAIGIFSIPTLVLADGMVLPDYEEKVYLPNQKAVISWDGEKEVMILSTKIKADNLANMAWIIPIPSKEKPEIEKGDIDIFYDLADLFREDRKAPGFFLGTGVEGPDKGVEVVEHKKIDIYDITTLKATDAQALLDWLNNNGYIVPETVKPVLDEYCAQEDFYFIANKINLANKYKDLTITDKDRTCAEAITEHYYTRYERIREQDIYWALEQMDECKEAAFEAVNVLVELAQGVATPIKITFQPQIPFYPLKISSLNDGDTIIDVYLFSETPLKDKSGILSAPRMTKNTSYLKGNYNLPQQYITYLTYAGNLKDLKLDSWFEEREYSSELDPKYVSWTERILYPLGYVIVILIFLAIIIFTIIGFVVVVRKIIAKFRKKP